MELYNLAFNIAEEAFLGKKDLAGEPYINHLKRVADDCIGETYKVVALLHDLLEDCPEWNEKVLRVFFPKNIVDAIVAMTHIKQQTYYQYITQVSENDIARYVKIRDLLDNMNITRLKELTQKDFDRLKKYHESYKRLVEHIESL